MVWQGAGLLVFIVFTLSILPIGKVVNYFELENIWTLIISFVFSGVVCWVLGRYLHEEKFREVKDKKTGETVLYENIHTAMYIKVEYWGVAFFVMGCVTFVFEIVLPLFE